MHLPTLIQCRRWVWVVLWSDKQLINPGDIIKAKKHTLVPSLVLLTGPRHLSLVSYQSKTSDWQAPILLASNCVKKSSKGNRNENRPHAKAETHCGVLPHVAVTGHRLWIATLTTFFHLYWAHLLWYMHIQKITQSEMNPADLAYVVHLYKYMVPKALFGITIPCLLLSNNLSFAVMSPLARWKWWCCVLSPSTKQIRKAIGKAIQAEAFKFKELFKLKAVGQGRLQYGEMERLVKKYNEKG